MTFLESLNVLFQNYKKPKWI